MTRFAEDLDSVNQSYDAYKIKKDEISPLFCIAARKLALEIDTACVFWKRRQKRILNFHCLETEKGKEITKLKCSLLIGCSIVSVRNR